MARAKKPQIHLTALVSLADYEFIPGAEGHCPIANALKSDPDILTPKVTDKKIVFSRRSTQSRYTYRTPLDAIRFIHAVDEIVETGQVPSNFTLILTDADLVRVTPRSRTTHDAGLRQARTHNDAVKVEGGKVIIEPRIPAGSQGHRPKRLNTAVAA